MIRRLQVYDGHVRIAMGILAFLATALTLVVPASAQDIPVGGSASITQGRTSAAGTGSVAVHWTAYCPDTNGSGISHYWYVETTVFHEDGGHANYISTAEAGIQSDSGTHNLVLQMRRGLRQETFSVQTILYCPPYQDTVLTQGAVTLRIKKSGGGDDGDGSGGGAAGGGSG